ncbi:MAG TPA: hypothetical protein VNU72_13595, partial [Puia sp.]|nr:hypothetical protein [Puia sp.]
MTGNQTRLFHIVLLSLVIAGGACNESKYLGNGPPLYSANKVKINSSVKLSGRKERALRGELNELLRPRLNGKLLGIRLKLWIYNIAGHPKKNKGLKHWLKYKVGEAPVLASPKLIEKNREVLQNHLENKGYFHDTVMVETPVKDKKLTAVFTAQVGPQYTIRNITYPADSDALGRRIDSLQRRSLLHKGDPFDLGVIKDERDRIDTRLKNRGFYFFNPDYLVVDVDSSVGNNQVDLFMKIKEDIPDPARNVYRINDVVVYAEYDIKKDSSLKNIDTTPEGYKIVDTIHYLRPIVYSKTLVFKPGDIYKRDDHNLSLSRLVSLGVFKFVKARFEPVDTSDENNKLNAFYYL